MPLPDRDPDLLYRAVGERLADVLDVAKVIQADPSGLDAKTIGRLSDIMVRALEEVWGFLGFEASTVDDILLARLHQHVGWRPSGGDAPAA